MKNRLVSLFALCAILLSGAFFTSCEDTATIPEPTFFGQIRVMNFAVCASAKSYDVYLYPENGPIDTIPNTPGLAYGISSPYTTNLATNKGAGQNYTLVVRAAGAKSGDLIKTTIMIKPNDKWSFVIFSEKGDGSPEYKLIDDNPTTPTEAGKAYFRFINTMPGDDPGPIKIVIDDPVNGTELTSGAVAYKDISDYKDFKTATDTTLTFYAVKSDGTVLGRLAGVALEGGTYKTVTWGGNCPDNYRQQEDGVTVRDDSNRVRILDDSGIGNDATIPVPQTMRFNFVNALVNVNVPESDPRFAGLHYQQLGVVINNDTRFNFTNMTPFSVGPTALAGRTQSLPNGSMYYENYAVSFPLTDAVNVKGFKTNPAQPDVRGTLLYDYRAGVRADIKSDMLTTFVVHDSIRFTKKISADKKDTSYVVSPLDSARGQFIIAVPDVPDANNATIVLANALAPGYKSSATVTNVKFYINDAQVASTGNWGPKKYQTLPPVAPGTITVKGTLNTTPVEEFSTSFNAEAGGIYEVLFVGERNHTNSAYHPRFIVLRANPKP